MTHRLITSTLFFMKKITFVFFLILLGCNSSDNLEDSVPIESSERASASTSEAISGLESSLVRSLIEEMVEEKVEEILEAIVSGTADYYFYSNSYNSVELRDQYQELAEEGDPEAQYYLGMTYASSGNQIEGFDQALRLFTLSAEQGYMHAQFALGYFYLYGFSSQAGPRPEDSIRWFSLAAEQDPIEVMYLLGLAFEGHYNGRSDTDRRFRHSRDDAGETTGEATSEVGWEVT